MKSQNRIFIAAALLIFVAPLGRSAAADDNSFVVFDDPAPKVRPVNLNIDYELRPSEQKFFIYLPPNYDDQTPFGLIVFTDSQDSFDHLPLGWSTVLRDHKLLFIAAQNAGNDQLIARRLGLAVLGATEMMQHHKIDPARIYAGGFSGGARVAGMLGFFQPTVFRGTVQICGADFYESVPKAAKQTTVVPPGDYGVFSASDDEIAGAKTVRFTLITGDNDFRYADIQDVFHGGFEKSSFSAKLIDVPGMKHANCSGRVFDAALTFLDQAPPLPLPAIAGPTEPQISLTAGSNTVVVPIPNGFDKIGDPAADDCVIGLTEPSGSVRLRVHIAVKDLLPDFAAQTIQQWADDYVKQITEQIGDRLVVKPELSQDPRFLFLMHYRARLSRPEQNPVVVQDVNLRLRRVGAVVLFSQLDVIGPDPAAVQDKADQAMNALLSAKMLALATPPVVEQDVPWLVPDPSKWPQILMHNFFANAPGFYGSAFLMKLPNGAVVVVTAKHVLGEKRELLDPEKMDIDWSVSSLQRPAKKLTLRKLAMHVDPTKPLDCVLATIDPMQSWPVEVMMPRTSPVELEEPVYAIGFARDGDPVQTVYKGSVTGHDDSLGQFTYTIDGDVSSQGFSGAPILDVHGQVVGIHLGGVADAAHNRYALDIGAALSVADAPPAVASPATSPVVASPAPSPAAVVPDLAKPADDENHTAADALQFADSYVTAGLYDKARERLQNIIAKYPATPAATQAKQRLKDIEGK